MLPSREGASGQGRHRPRTRRVWNASACRVAMKGLAVHVLRTKAPSPGYPSRRRGIARQPFGEAPRGDVAGCGLYGRGCLLGSRRHTRFRTACALRVGDALFLLDSLLCAPTEDAPPPSGPGEDPRDTGSRVSGPQDGSAVHRPAARAHPPDSRESPDDDDAHCSRCCTVSTDRAPRADVLRIANCCVYAELCITAVMRSSAPCGVGGDEYRDLKAFFESCPYFRSSRTPHNPEGSLVSFSPQESRSCSTSIFVHAWSTDFKAAPTPRSSKDFSAISMAEGTHALPSRATSMQRSCSCLGSVGVDSRSHQWMKRPSDVSHVGVSQRAVQTVTRMRPSVTCCGIFVTRV